ncbi:HNH endonuclease [Putridiphycobacter roseus]|uniref:HNH endonuclease n=1 Tax=Putridiphycobacter roseus TaxID=2219161 RepID=A0A2W1N8N4_9FLAO|nr:HNH endonuclease [Putridiphycobacter roseus]PZE15605.1 HNH endonuclease [Putridiphycobacter roseus]
MIKLNRTHTPACLSPKFVKEKTDEFKNSAKNVWNINDLKNSLLELSFNKCAYCECALKEESKYMEVEHFQDKDDYPDLVLNWENLLPSCKRCNGSKSTHDVLIEPIINPFNIEPINHLRLRNYRFKGKDTLGKTTIDVVNLNNTERAVLKRFEVGEELQKTIENILEKLELYNQRQIIQRRNKLLNSMEELLKECQPNSIYSSTCSTILHSDENYQFIRSELVRIGLWNANFEKLHNDSLIIVFED